VLLGHDGAVTGVAFSPNGQRLAGADATVRIWNPARAAAVVVLRGHDGAVNGVAFSPNGQRLASGGADGTLVWHCEVCGAIDAVRALAKRRSLRTLTSEERKIFAYGLVTR
jgi:WD40 repeat protein